MIFLFFYWANRPKTYAVRNNTNLLSNLWPSAEVEPCSGLMTPSPAADGRLVYFGPLFKPSCSCRRSPGGCTASSTRPFLRYSGSWMCSDACSPARSIRHAPWDQSVVSETDATSPWIQQQLWRPVCWLQSRARKNRILPPGEAARFFHDLLIKRNHPTNCCCFAEQCFFFSPDFPKWKLLRQTEKIKDSFSLSIFPTCNKILNSQDSSHIYPIKIHNLCVVVFSSCLSTKAQSPVCEAKARTQVS